MQLKSYTKRLFIFIEILISSLIILLGISVFVTGQTAFTEMQKSDAMYLNSLVNQMELRLEGIEKNFERFLYDNTDLKLLQTEKEADRQYAAIRLQKTMASLMNTDDNAEMLIVADGKYDLCLDASNSSFDWKQKEAMRQFVMAYAEQDKNQFLPLSIQKINDGYFVMILSAQKGKAAAIFLSLDALLEIVDFSYHEDIQLLLMNEKNTVLWKGGKTLLKAETGKSLENTGRYHFRKISEKLNELGSLRFMALIKPYGSR